jgi:Ca2+-transporting ATPase
VAAAGTRSELSKIGHSPRPVAPEPSRLSLQTERLARFFGFFGAAVAVLAAVLHGTLRGDWFEGALAGIAPGMAMLPEEFPVVLAVFMAMGAWRISQAGVLTRRATAIETPGAATMLCTDKTGTLTGNRMTVQSLHARPRTAPGPAMPPLPLGMADAIICGLSGERAAPDRPDGHRFSSSRAPLAGRWPQVPLAPRTVLRPDPRATCRPPYPA